MNTREKFGNYVLLKKLAEDALGETFRAGRFGDQGIEQVVLLRVFDSPGLDTAALWQRVSQRGAIQSGLLSPNLGNGIDFGELQGVPYVVYDYISGTNLTSLMEQAERQFSPIPVDHALLIMERVALGLSAAYENRHQGSRILHGFLVPNLVMVSNEGEARLLGFEVSSGLRELAAQNPTLRSFERYLAPEALTGAAPDKADDVYSLGVLLYELLTGQAFAPGAGGVPALLQQAKLANEGEPMPAPISQFLQNSLASKESRIADSPAWHKTLSQLMIDQQYNPTTSNPAFFMHNLSREEIEKESQEIQVEKSLEDARDTLEVAAPAEEPAEAEGGPETVLVSDIELSGAAAAAEEPKSRTGLLGTIAALLALVTIGGGGYWYFVHRQTPPPPPPPPAVAVPVEPEPVVPAGPSQEEIQEELERMRLEMADALAAQSEEMKQTLAAQYEGKIKELQDQYDDSQKAAAARRRKEQEAALAAQQAAIAAEAQRQALAQAQAAAPPPPPPPPASPSGPAEDSKQAAANEPAAPPRAAPSTTETTPEKPAPVVAKAEPPPPPPPPARPKVRPGQLVEPGPGVTAPKLVRQAAARYPPMARRVRREATVIVRVLVDETGKVIKAETLGKKVGLGIDEAALDAARDSRFRAATKDGVPVKMWHSLRFDFRP